MTLDGYASPGMSGGLGFDSKGVAKAMMLKKLPDSNPNSKPLTLAVSIDLVRKELSNLWHGARNMRDYNFTYRPGTEEITFTSDEISFRELTHRKFHNYRLAADPHDIGGMNRAKNLVNINEDHSGLIKYLNTQGSAVIVSGMKLGSRYFSDYSRFLNSSSNYVLVVQEAQGQTVGSMADLMRIMRDKPATERLKLTIALKSLDGRLGLMELGGGARESVSKLNLLVSSLLESYHGHRLSPAMLKEKEELESLHSLVADLMNSVMDSHIDGGERYYHRKIIF